MPNQLQLNRSYQRTPLNKIGHAGTERIKYDTGVYDTEYFSRVNSWQYDPLLYKEEKIASEDMHQYENSDAALTENRSLKDCHIDRQELTFKNKEQNETVNISIASSKRNSSEVKRNNDTLMNLGQTLNVNKSAVLLNDENPLCLESHLSCSDDKEASTVEEDSEDNSLVLRLESSNDEINHFQQNGSKQAGKQKKI